jgi:hypothetical protein
MQRAICPLALLVLACGTGLSRAELLAHYEFSRSFLDSSSNGYHGNPSTTLSFVDGPAGFGPALRLSNGAYAAGPHYPDPPQYIDRRDGVSPRNGAGLTVAAWIKWSSRASAEADVIVSTGTTNNGWRLFRSSLNQLSFEMRGPGWGCGGGGAQVVMDGRWHHYAVTVAFAEGAFKSYVDGRLDGFSGGGPMAGQQVFARIRVGGQANAMAYFSGCLDDLRIYDEALDESAIAALMVPPPVLSITRQASQVVISWPAAAGSFLLEGGPCLEESAAWQPIEGTPVLANQFWRLTLESTNPACFFRLRPWLGQR